MNRRAIALLALLMAIAAPAKAWCEASCLDTAHAQSTTSHCPTHEPANDGDQFSRTGGSECPRVEAARLVPVTLAVPQPESTTAPGASAPRALASTHPVSQASSQLRHLRSVPLRI